MFNRESKAISGVQPQMDDTDKQAVSLYVKHSAAGDMAVRGGPYGGLAIGALSDVGLSGDIFVARAGYDGLSLGANNLFIGLQKLYNGSTYDRIRNNLSLSLLASAARTATTYSADQTNFNANAALFIFDVTAVPGSDTVQLIVQIKDPVSGKYVTVLDGTAESAVGTYIYAVGLGVSDAESKFDAIEGIALPRTWRVGVIHSAATSFTYSVGGFLIN